MTDPNRRKNLSAQVHRFGNHVAIHVGTGETTYLTAYQASRLSSALRRAARAVRNEPAAENTFGTFRLAINPYPQE